MTFGDFCGDLEALARRHGEAGTPVRVEVRGQVARAYAPGAAPEDLARCGLEEVAELASDAAEHHPYWGALSGCAAILDTLLERWSGELTDEDVSQMRWDVGRIEAALGRSHR